MASRLSFDRDLNQILTEGTNQVRKVILNRPKQWNSLTYEMVSQMTKIFQGYEDDDTVKLIILTGQGKAFCAGGDVVRVVQLTSQGHYTLSANFYKKQLLLDYMIATFKKPVVVLINGVVMGGGAGLSMNGRFRVVTENTVFSMPEVSIGLYPDVGASYFLSRLPGHFGEFLGLTGARISGIEILHCGLATHFVFSKDLKSLENELSKPAYMDSSNIPNALHKFIGKPNLKQGSVCTRLDIINKCFGKKTVEDILSSLEAEAVNCGEKWMVDAINCMKSASPTSLNICLKTIREGRRSTLGECLKRDFVICQHMLRRTHQNDFLEGARAVFFDKDKTPKWDPPKLEEVSDEHVEQFFRDDYNDSGWDFLEFPERKITKINKSKL